ncbi:response regulator [Paenibacillus sp. HJL G12]|uniref:Response regulator n=1 Tax=Paenibacillus dendrobii TaxID=2691084 RepID=A0A7X3INI0_9BACL|nr:response regulator [Paenibacillus dendrobii]MWV47219.1 response regulator [Paenibacillus dendrobii]
MYSIFLVDDEELELEMMRDYIRWEEMGLYVAGTAVNGRDAAEKIEMIQPDIVLTDVQMPIMNGLDLAKHIRERYEWMQLVFLTGHDEFNYVKSALNMGAVGYLLKPLDLGEIVSVIEKVKHRCEEVRMKNRSIKVTRANIIRELTSETNEDRIVNLAASFRKLSRHPEDRRYSLALLHIDGKNSDEKHFSVEEAGRRLGDFMENWLQDKKLDADIVTFKEGEIGIFMDSAHRPGYFAWEDAAALIRGTLHFSVTAAVHEQEEELPKVQQLYKQAKMILDELFYKGRDKVITAKDVQTQWESEEVPPFAETDWFEAVNRHDLDEAQRLLREHVAKMVTLRTAKNKVRDGAIRLIEHVLEQIHEPILESSKRAELYHDIYQCETIYDIEEMVLEGARHAVSSIQQRFVDKNAKLVHQVRSMMDQNFHTPITINSLSDQVYLSPNYLRSIFKEKMGMTIHDYLTRIRLDKAKEYLADESLKVQDIAQKVGYESTSYFISLFLKNQGVTPNEYRKNLLLG